MRLNKRTGLIISGFIGLLLTTTGGLMLLERVAQAPVEEKADTAETVVTPPPTQEPIPVAQTTPKTPAVFSKKQYSTDTPSSLWVVVNKQRPLPSSYAPAVTTVSSKQLRKEAADSVTTLMSAASKAGASMTIISAYRSYSAQNTLYNNYVKKDGQAAADRYSARPGHSEHQTGLAADLGASSGSCALEICFADTAQGKWLAAHAHEYGFIIRYPNGAESRTGYQYEPWHIRYVGKEAATEIYKSGQTMEEFFGLPAAPSY